MKNKHAHLNDRDLLTKTFIAATNEKEAMIALLEYLAEVDRRKVYAIKAYSSLFEYIVKELGFSESQAAERVNAVRLMSQSSDVKTYLESGDLTLTSAAQIQRFFQAEKKIAGNPLTETVKIDLIQDCRGRSKREVEKVLFERASQPVQSIMKEKVRAISSERIEIKFSINRDTNKKIARVKELIQINSLEEIFDQALAVLIEKEEKKRGMQQEMKSERKSEHKAELELVIAPPATQLIQSNNIYSRYIPMEFKRTISNRSKGQCEYLDRKNIRCASRHRLQIDHRIPLARNGTTTPENLRHLCSNHNARAAMEWGFFKYR